MSKKTIRKKIKNLDIKLFLLDKLRDFIQGDFKTQVCNEIVVSLNELNNLAKELKAHR